ncbi:cadherin-like domain-containing protein [Phycisphaeraceae bacterium D3-23]
MSATSNADRARVEPLEPRLLFSSVPVPAPDFYSGEADEVLALDGLVLNDYDADGDTLSALSWTLPSNGTLSFDAEGGPLYTPDAGFVGTDTIRYGVSDGTPISYTDGLEGLYRFDDGSGTSAADAAANGLDATLHGGAGWVTDGHLGGAITFDGVDGYADTPFVLDPSATAFSASVWVNFDTIPQSGSGVILSQRNGSGVGRSWLYINSSGQLRSSLGAGSLGSATALTAGSWHHVAISHDGTTLRLYLDGDLVDSAAATMESTDGGMVIGGNKSNSAHFMDGTVDELRVYDRALSGHEVAWQADRTLADITITVNASVDIEAARDQLLSGVTALADPGSSGQMVVYGPTAFSVSNYPGAGLTDPMIAAATWGAGRVVALPDDGWLDMGTHGSHTDTATFYANSLAWLSDSTDLGIKLVTYNNASNASWLTAQGYTDVVNATSATLAAELADADVLVAGWLGNDPPQADLDVIDAFVSGQGGGLLIAEYGEGYGGTTWAQPIVDAPGNRLLREAGIGFVAGTHTGTHTIDRAVGQMAAQDVFGIFDNTTPVIRGEKLLAANLYDQLIGVLPSNDTLLARLNSAYKNRVVLLSPILDTNARHIATQAGTSITSAVQAEGTTYTPGDQLVFHHLRPGGRGTVVDNGDGTFTHTPDPGYTGFDAFSYELFDAQNDRLVRLVIVNIGEVAQPVDFVTTGGTVEVGTTGTYQYELNIDFASAPAYIEHLWIDWGDGKVSYGNKAGWGTELTQSAAAQVWTATYGVDDPDAVRHIRVFASDVHGKAYQSKVTLNQTQTPVFNVDVELLSQSEVRLTWAERFLNETGYTVSASTDGGVTYTPWETVVPEATSALLRGLDPGKTYHFKIDVLTGDDTRFTSEPTVFTTQMPAADPEGLLRWFRVQIPSGGQSPSRGESTSTDLGSSLTLRGNKTISLSGSSWELVQAVSYEAAIWIAITGSAEIEESPGQSKRFEFERDGAFRVGQYSKLESLIPGFDLGTTLPPEQYIITLEDLFTWTNISVDYDAWFWRIDVVEASAELDIALAVEHVDRPAGETFEAITVNSGETGEIIVPLDKDEEADIEFSVEYIGTLAGYLADHNCLDDLEWILTANDGTNVVIGPTDGEAPTDGIIEVTLAPPAGTAPTYTLSVQTEAGELIASVDLVTVNLLSLEVADKANPDHSVEVFPDQFQSQPFYVGADDTHESVIDLTPQVVTDAGDVWSIISWEVSGPNAVQGPNIGDYNGPVQTKTLLAVNPDGGYPVYTWLDRNHNGAWDYEEIRANAMVDPVALEALTATNTREVVQTLTATTSQAEVPTLYVTETLMGLPEIELMPTVTPAASMFVEMVQWEVVSTDGGGFSATGTFGGAPTLVGLPEVGASYTAYAWLDLDGDGTRDAGEIQTQIDIVAVGFDGLEVANEFGVDVLAEPDQNPAEPPRLWVPFVQNEGDIELIPLYEPDDDPEAGKFIMWEIEGGMVNGPTIGHFAGGAFETTLVGNDTPYTIYAWVDGNSNQQRDSHEIVTQAIVEPVYVETFAVEDTRNGNSETATEQQSRFMSVPLDGLHNAEGIRLSATLNGPADLIDDAMPFLSWDVIDPQVDSYVSDVPDFHFGPGDQATLDLLPGYRSAPEYIMTVGWDFSGNDKLELDERSTSVAVRTLALENLTVESVVHPDIYTTHYSPAVPDDFQQLKWISIPVTDTDGNQAEVRFEVEAMGGGPLAAETFSYAWWEIGQRNAGLSGGDLATVTGTFNADGTPNLDGPILLDLLDLDRATEYIFRVGLDVDRDMELENNEMRYVGQAFLYYFNVRVDSNNNTRLNFDDDLVEEDTTRPGKWIRVTEQNNTDIPLEVFLGDAGLPGGVAWRWDWSGNLTILRNVGGLLTEAYDEEVTSSLLALEPIAGPPEIDPDGDGYERFYLRADDPSVILAQESFAMTVLGWDSNDNGNTINNPADGDVTETVHLTAYEATGEIDFIVPPLTEANEEVESRYVPLNDTYNGGQFGDSETIRFGDADLVHAEIVLQNNAPGFLELDRPDNLSFWVETVDVWDFLHEDHFDQGAVLLEVSGDYIRLDDGLHLQGLWSGERRLDVLIEGVEASPNNTSHLVTASYVYDDTNETLDSDAVRLVVTGIDLDVDSDNTNGLSLPDFSHEEEVLEEDGSDLGKIVYVDDSLAERYTPLYLSVLAVQAATDSATFELTYTDADSGGALRILTIDGTYLAPGVHDLSVLNIDRNQNDALLWIEAVDNGQGPVTQTIEISIDPDGANPIEGYTFTDIVRVTPRIGQPQAAIFSHANDTYRSVISSDTAVLGMVDDPDDDLTGWQLLLVPVNVHEGTGIEPFVVATSTSEALGSAADPAPLGTIQPALLDDGIYQLQLVATDYTKDDNGTAVPDFGRGRVVSGHLIQIQNGLHQQVYVHPVTDLALDAPGLPTVTLGRYYDSSQAETDQGLGYGWTLTLPQARITRLAELAGGEDVSAGLRRGDLVTTLIPGRGQVSFAFEPRETDSTPGAEVWEPRFVSIDGSGSVLGFAWDDAAYRLIQRDGEFFVEELDGLQRTLAYDPANDALPGSYLVTMLDGWSYEIDFAAGLVTTATDAVGNTVTYRDTGISAGNESIHIERDAETGRILWASTDPSGNGPRVTYGYDIATGDLTSVTDQAGRTTYYTYDADHRLTVVTDTQGVEQIAVAYEPDGRVSAIDRLATDREPGVVPEGAEYVYNERNELLRIIQTQHDAQGAVTGYSVGAFTYEHVDLEDADFEPVYRTFDRGGETYRYTEAAFIRTVKQATWLPFEITGVDADGLRFTQAPEVQTGEVTYRAWPEDFDGTDLTQLDHLGVPVQQARLAADGKTWLIGESEYHHTTNQATTTTDPYGNVVTNTFDAAGNLIEFVETDADGNVLEHLRHVYTESGVTQYVYALDGLVADVSSLAAGLWLESVRVLDETTQATVSLGRNIYYGSAASAGSGPVGTGDQPRRREHALHLLGRRQRQGSLPGVGRRWQPGLRPRELRRVQRGGTDHTLRRCLRQHDTLRVRRGGGARSRSSTASAATRSAPTMHAAT